MLQSTSANTAAPKKRMFSRKTKRMLVAYSFIAPNFIGYFIITLIPVFASFVLSVFDWTGASTMNFIGFDNYARMFTNDTFVVSLQNTLVYAIFTVPITMALSLILALLLNSKLLIGRNAFRAICFFPHVAAVVAIAATWNMLFSAQATGPVNRILMAIGVAEANLPRWTADVKWAMPSVIMCSVWRSMGYYMIIYLAALQGISPELYEAGKIDGASDFQLFRYITLPMLTPTTFFVVMMLTVGCFKVYDLIYVLTQGGPGRATSVLVMHIYKSAFTEYRFGYACAVSVILFLIVLLVTLIQFAGEKKWARNF